MDPSGEIETPEGVLKTPAPPVPLSVDTKKELADAFWIGINKSGLKNKGINVEITSFRDLLIPIILVWGSLDVYGKLGYVQDIWANIHGSLVSNSHWLFRAL